LCGLILAGAPAGAQDAKPADPGTTPSTFRSYIVADGRTPPTDPQNRTGKQHDLIDGNGLNPVVGVFTGRKPVGPDDSLTKLVKRLSQVQADYRQDQFGAFVLFTVLDKEYVADDKADATAKAIAEWATAVQPGAVVLGLAKKPDGKPGDATNWNLAPDTTTVVFYNRHKVLKRWDVKDDAITDEMVNAVAAEVGQALKKK
jgi:hypothetical protein